jgi:hypothetical protein
LKETAAAFFPSKTDGKGMKLVLQDTGVDGLTRLQENQGFSVAALAQLAALVWLGVPPIVPRVR